MRDLYEIQFYPLNEDAGPLGYESVDRNVAAGDIRQIMANWYVNISAQFFRNIEDVEQDLVDWHLTGLFVVRNAAGAVIERVTSDVVKSSPEIVTADPLWFEKPGDFAGECFPELNEVTEQN